MLTVHEILALYAAVMIPVLIAVGIFVACCLLSSKKEVEEKEQREHDAMVENMAREICGEYRF